MLDNPIGFGASDFIELALALLLAPLALIWRPWIEPVARKIAEQTVWSIALLAVLPVALRLALLPHHPAPAPDIYDEFGHLLTADTLLHFRLANPPHALRQFFETFYVLQEPSYSSIYAIGQGAALAIGRLIFGHPWAGVLLSVAAFCPLCYWMLRGWTTPGWALAGGVLAVLEFGPLNEWMNGYWGGAVAAAAGCLVFGALPRLRQNQGARNAVLLGLGLAMHVLTRPYESVFLLLSVILFFARGEMRKLARALPVAGLVVLPAIAITLVQNKQATGRWTMLPYVLARDQYGVPAAFTFEPNPIPHRELTPQQQMSYRSQVSYHGESPDTPGRFFERLEYRVRFYRFFFFPALYLALPFFPALREWRFVWVLLTLLMFGLGATVYPFFFPHYIAALTCLFVLMSVTGLERLSRWPAGAEAARIVALLCIVHFLFWYGLHVFDDKEFSLALRRFETWDAINHQNPERRIEVNRQLTEIPGKLLVFVRYTPRHPFQDEWVYNAADIDGARIVWARDLGEPENEKLRRYYPDRTVMLLEPDVRPPRLGAYEPGP